MDILSAFRALGIAAGLGMLVGLQREWANSQLAGRGGSLFVSEGVLPRLSPAAEYGLAILQSGGTPAGVHGPIFAVPGDPVPARGGSRQGNPDHGRLSGRRRSFRGSTGLFDTGVHPKAATSGSELQGPVRRISLRCATTRG